MQLFFIKCDDSNYLTHANSKKEALHSANIVLHSPNIKIKNVTNSSYFYKIKKIHNPLQEELAINKMHLMKSKKTNCKDCPQEDQ